MPNVVLVGFMGTGKTSVGRRLSERLDMSLIDTDDVISQDSGMTIADIFKQYGESHFRDLEHEAVRKISMLDNHVISTGGGVVLREANLEALKRNGVIFCLTATAAEIWQRVGHETHRPLLQTADPRGKIQEMLTERGPYYARADHEVHTTGLSIDAVADKIVRVFQHAITSR